MFTEPCKALYRQVSQPVFTGGYRDTLTVHNLNAQSEYYTMQPAPGPSSSVQAGRYGAFTYGRIGTHDKSMFGLPLCQMPGEGKVKRTSETWIKRKERKRDVKTKEREEKRDSLLPLCSFHRLQISDTLPVPVIFRGISSSPVIDTCTHINDPRRVR